MVITVRNNVDRVQLDGLLNWVKSLGLEVHISVGVENTVLGLVGDTSKVDIDLVRSLEIVESANRIQEPFKSVNRKFKNEDTIIDIGGFKFGGGHFQIIAGPCSVESNEQVLEIAKAVKAAGATLLRGGAFKPRSSPYSFQGLGLEGLNMLINAKKETGMPIVTEIMSEKYLEYCSDVDLIQIGARNMQNFDLLKAVGKYNKPVLLKRGLANTIEEWLMSAEYIMAEGNENVILCERGIRTFETYTRNTLDLSAVPVLKEKTHLPVIVDPSHAAGMSKLVKPLSLASVGAGADGLIIEVHNNPEKALCDGAQCLRPTQFDETVKLIKQILPVVNKEMP